jgi:N-acetylglucosaminyldiphosphoundecaprenol N-acetyl-beta-D-mannosaminyltransferase
MDEFSGITQRTREVVLESLVDVISWQEAERRVITLAKRRVGAYVCICNVHSIVTAWRTPDFRAVVNDADMVTPDGAPIAWALRAMGHASQERINGPDLMWNLCGRASGEGVSVFLYGSTCETVQALIGRLVAVFPDLVIAGYHCPPFRPLTETENEAVVREINESGAGIVFVSLGCPKQERWIADHRKSVSAVALGVGAAFDYHAGTVRRAPGWMQRCGLEWLYRLYQEPTRLWKRYLVTNSLFLIGISVQMFACAAKRRRNVQRG